MICPCTRAAPAQQPLPGTVASVCYEISKKVNELASTCLPLLAVYRSSFSRDLRVCCLALATRNALQLEAPVAVRD